VAVLERLVDQSLQGVVLEDLPPGPVGQGGGRGRGLVPSDLRGCGDGRPRVLGPDGAAGDDGARQGHGRNRGEVSHVRSPPPAPPAGGPAGSDCGIDVAPASALRCDNRPTITKRARAATMTSAVAASAPAIAISLLKFRTRDISSLIIRPPPAGPVRRRGATPARRAGTTRGRA